MLKNYLLTTWRNLSRNKLFSGINLFGLAIGLGCFLLITIYVLDELSYDRFNTNADRIYRVTMDAHWGGADLHIAQSSDIMGPVIKKEFPGVEEVTRIYTYAGTRLIHKGEQYIPETGGAYVDSTFFNVFTLPAIDGNPKTALTEPRSVVLTASFATKYFGTPQAAGRTLEMREDKGVVPYKVGAVIRDIPANAHFHYDFLLAMKGLDYQWNQPGNENFYTYVLLKKGVAPSSIERLFEPYFIKYELPMLKSFQITTMEQFRKSGNYINYFLEPLTDIHLRSHRIEEMDPNGSLQYVYIFSIVAVFILLIACVNFMNLTTARSAGRAKEVGIRKVLGTSRRQLMRQFLVESIFLVTVSLILALGLAALGLPLFNNLSGKSIPLSHLFSPTLLSIIFLLPLIVGLFAGSYPAFFLSGFRPIEVLKGQLKTGAGGERLRSVLVVFQFTTSIVLMVGTLVVYRQLNFMRNRDRGFNKEQVLIVDGTDALGNQVQSFKREVLRQPDIKSGTITSFLPVARAGRNNNNVFKGPAETTQNAFNTQWWCVDYDYLQTMCMTLIKGRNYSASRPTDSSAVIINETVAAMLGPGDPIGKNIYRDLGNGSMGAQPIIGVVKNFNYESMHQPIGPLIMHVLWPDHSAVAFRVATPNLPATLTRIRDAWKSMNTGTPFTYRFMDQAFDEMYKADQQVGKIALVFASLALVIGCMGIFGLAAFLAERRTKEIGIRKVLGASTGGILGLLSAEFTRLVGISFVIATPLAGWAMHRWLLDFAYRTSLPWWIFAVAGAATFAIALITVSFQSLKAATTNPVTALRAE
ncbi:MAG TPA: ABC transporter permease [Puia sp.]|nr:ABC transporter permease [Puia sp.]